MTDSPSAPAPSSEPLTGRAAEEQKHGFRPMATHDGPPPTKKPKEFTSARDAGEELIGQRRRTGNVTEPPDEIAYRNRDGSLADSRETVTLNRAADDRKEYLDARAGMVDAIDTMDVADRIDALRRENADAIAEFNGTPSPPQIEQVDPEAQQFERDAIAAGVDPALAKVLQNPQARKALESEFEKVGHIQQLHSAQVQIAQHMARDAWQSQFPELARLSPEQASAALQNMQRTNPQRFNAAMASLSRVGEAVATQNQLEQQRAHVERQQFLADSERQDAAFDRMVGPRTIAQRQAIAEETLAYATELGIDKNTLIHLYQTNPIMRHSAFQKMMHDAVTARISRREGSKYRDHIVRDVPPVQRPGTSGPRGSGRPSSENLQALARKASASGNLRDMAAYLVAKRKGR